MRILLDENIPVQLKPYLPGYFVASVNDKDVGWKNIANGRLLSEMEGRFDLLITADKNIYVQQISLVDPSRSLCCPQTGEATSFR